ncbi:MAG: flagellar biosynthetic protein FliO [Telluria sp.]|nr:flagellar biosynthetic protein FliO [Telluria sp.]
MIARFLLALAIAACLAPPAVLAGQNAAPGRIAQPGAPASPAATPDAGGAPAAADQAAAAPEVSAAAAQLPAPQPPAAAAATRVAAAPAAPPAASAGNLLQTIVALCLVLGLLAMLAWFLKRYGPKAAAGPARLRIVGALNLGGRERIMVVEVGEQWIVVGASPGRVNALATLARPPEAADAALPERHAPFGNSFSDWLKQTIDKRNAK